MTSEELERAMNALVDCNCDVCKDRVIDAIRSHLATPQQERKPDQCEWKPEDEDFMPGTYASACGELWSFIDGGPNENRVRFCHGCGNPVILKENP